MVSDGEEDRPAAPAELVVLTKPLALDGGLAAEHEPPNLFQQGVGLFKNVHPGMDLTHFQLPAVFNLPKSQLQCYGETVYCVTEDLLGRCARGKTSLDRFTAVVAWSISTQRPTLFGLAPLNPILGETHHVSRGNLHVLLEQVSHRPPVAALHATDTEEGVELLWCHNLESKFTGTAIKIRICGKREMKLTNFGESYEMNSPSMVINLLPVPGAEWAGKVSIVCRESGLEAELRYHQRRTFFFGFGSTPGVIKGRIFHSKSLTTIYEIDGRWNKKVTIKDVHSGEVRVLYDAVENISRLKTPVVRNPHAVAVTESAAVWGKVSGEILRRNWGGAAKLKAAVEERERGKAATRTTWEPQFFHLRPKKEGGWSCRPKLAAVPAAPITADL